MHVSTQSLPQEAARGDLKQVEAQEPKLCPAPAVTTKLAACPKQNCSKQIHVVELD